jgi:predicted O-methyltransferase YrrM
MREIRTVLEFGCGNYSTFTFLNRAAFPHLEQLLSIENDVAWAETLRASVKDDERWRLELVEGEISDSVAELNLEAFDLILIDDSKTSAQRAATIRNVVRKQPRHPWIVVHDFEVDDYQRAATGFRERHRYRASNPETGLMWNNGDGPSRLKTFNRILKNNAGALAPDDIEGWIKSCPVFL